MWICILIGIRGQFKSILGIHHRYENKIENVSIFIQQDRAVHFFDVNIKKQNPASIVAMGQFLYFNFAPFIEGIFHPRLCSVSPIYSHIIDACGLRAPPKVIFSL